MYPHPFDVAPIARQIWDSKYRLKDAGGAPLDADVDATWWRVARAVADAEKGGAKVRARWAERFHALLSDFKFLPAGRIIAGAGTGRRVTLFNCFVMGEIQDDLASIFEHVREAALTMQQGGGIGHDFSSLRPQGAPVQSTGSDASGPVSFMDVWDAMCRTIMSSGARRGAMMGTMRCDHPDIERFIDIKSAEARLRNFNLSVLVTVAFIDAVRADAPWDLVFGGRVWRTVPARRLWDRIMRATYDYAEPGVIFIDRINTRNNLAYCETIRATNPCVTADTWVHTDAGPRQVRDLSGRAARVLVNGDAYATGDRGFFATGRKPTVRLETKEGYSLRLTPDHLLRCVVRKTRWSLETAWKPAGSLTPGDEVVLNDHRKASCWPGAHTEAEGYLAGLLVGDGTLNDDKAVLSVFWPAIAANGGPGGLSHGVQAVMDAAMLSASTLRHRADFKGWIEVRGRNEMRLALGALRDLAFRLGMSAGDKPITAAIECASSDFYHGFLRGMFDADGSVQGAQTKGVSVRLAQSDRERLQAIQRMLLRLGIASTIYLERRPAGVRELPDGRGGSSEYTVAEQHELVISGDNLLEYRRLIGFCDVDKLEKLDRALFAYRRSLNRERFTAHVASIEDGCEEDVFDVEVPGVNAFDANGIYAHNCGEQPLPPYGACLLGSLNLARLVAEPFTPRARLDIAEIERLTLLAVRFLDNCIDVSSYPLPAQKQEALAKRRIGLGVTGLGDALIFLGQRYGSPEAIATTEAAMAAIERAAYLASAELARIKRPFPLCDRDRLLAAPNIARLPAEVRSAIAEHGLRNGCITSIAPTGTISLLAGNVSSGVEPVFDLAYTRNVRTPEGGSQEEQITDFAYAMWKAGAHGKSAGANREGGAPLPAALPAAFVTAADLTPRAHLEMQAALQRHVDSSISKTINCPVDIAFDDFKDIYLEAYDLGLKGCTTFRPNAVTGSVLTASPSAGTGGATAAASGPRTISGSADGTMVGAPRNAAGSTSPPLFQPPVETSFPLTPAPSQSHAVQSSAPPASLGPPPSAHPSPTQPGIVYMVKPLERDSALPGFTYKLTWPGSDHAIYVTINDIERDGRRRPFEIFINSRNLEHYAWTVALTRMISAVFRRGGDVSFVVDELKAIFDPQGGHWVGGRYVPSLLAAIGEIIEGHMVRTGWLTRDTPQPYPPLALRENAPATTGTMPSMTAGSDHPPETSSDRPPPRSHAPEAPLRRGSACPRCALPELFRVEGCWVCRSCGYSRCG